MILIITHKMDFTADFVVDKLNKLGYEYYRLNCEDILLKNNIKILFGDNDSIEINGVQNFNSIWFRRTKFPDFEGYDNSIKAYCYDEIDSFFSNLWSSIDCNKWLSSPEKVYKAENKVFQLKKAKEIGFKIPSTLITGNANQIREFFYFNKKNVIIKPIFENRFVKEGEQSLIFTNKLNEQNLIELEERIPLPSIYQAYIEKEVEYRITVVDNNVFTASVDSQSDEVTKVDWRKKKLKFQQSILPETINKMCVELTKNLGLNFGAIDLIKDNNGDYYFLEINPNGQWAWIEIDTLMPISDSIINYLNS